MPAEILSVGIDIGTSTTQVIFSKLLMDNLADLLAQAIGLSEREPLRFGDIGVLLGSSIRCHPLLRQQRQLTASETIRATVVGAGTYTTSISGSTIA